MSDKKYWELSPKLYWVDYRRITKTRNVFRWGHMTGWAFYREQKALTESYVMLDNIFRRSLSNWIGHKVTSNIERILYTAVVDSVIYGLRLAVEILGVSLITILKEAFGEAFQFQDPPPAETTLLDLSNRIDERIVKRESVEV